MADTEYRSQAARDAQASKYGDKDYWRYLDEASRRAYDYWQRRGDAAMADKMFTQSLSESLMGNDGA